MLRVRAGVGDSLLLIRDPRPFDELYPCFSRQTSSRTPSKKASSSSSVIPLRATCSRNEVLYVLRWIDADPGGVIGQAAVQIGGQVEDDAHGDGPRRNG